VSLSAVFVVLGAGSATFAARVPAVKASLHLSSGSLGGALLGSAVGLVVAAPTAGVLLRRVGPRPVIAVGLALFATGLRLIASAGGAVSLFAVLVLWGFGAGLVDVGINTEAAALQARAGRPIMSRFHAGWSVGGLVGSALGAVAAGVGVGVGVHFGVAAALVAVVGAAAVWSLDGAAAPSRPPQKGRGARTLRPRVPLALVALGAVAFGDFMAEGAANDWSAVYLHGSLGASPGFAALGFTTFALAMACGRLAGDHLTTALGPVRLVRCAGGLAATAMAVGLLVGRPVVALVAFGLLGAGLSVVVPLVFSAAARVGTAGTSVATVTGFGYCGLMLGPPLIGGLAEVVGVPGALVVVVVAAVASVALAGAVGRR
jgi:MFS family permease